MQNKYSSKNGENSMQNTPQKASVTLCPKCGTSVTEIMETGFVGCEKCYELPTIKNAVDKMFGGKRHKQ